jgi:hypothetical protein
MEIKSVVVVDILAGWISLGRRCRLVFNVRGNILGCCRGRGFADETGDAMSPLKEPSRANEWLLIAGAVVLLYKYLNGQFEPIWWFGTILILMKRR